MAFPHRGQRSAVCCVTQDEWKLDVAADDFSPSPDSFLKEPMRSTVDKTKLEQLFNRYRGKGRPRPRGDAGSSLPSPGAEGVFQLLSFLCRVYKTSGRLFLLFLVSAAACSPFGGTLTESGWAGMTGEGSTDAAVVSLPGAGSAAGTASCGIVSLLWGVLLRPHADFPRTFVCELECSWREGSWSSKSDLRVEVVLLLTQCSHVMGLELTGSWGSWGRGELLAKKRLCCKLGTIVVLLKSALGMELLLSKHGPAAGRSLSDKSVPIGITQQAVRFHITCPIPAVIGEATTIQEFIFFLVVSKVSLLFQNLKTKMKTLFKQALTQTE